MQSAWSSLHNLYAANALTVPCHWVLSSGMLKPSASGIGYLAPPMADRQGQQALAIGPSMRMVTVRVQRIEHIPS